jgi:hypothetical protein
MDVKRVAMVIAITALLPLFIGLFIDAVYPEPQYSAFCNDSYYGGSYPMKAIPASVNCTYVSDPKQDQCYRDGGQPEYNYTDDGCSHFSSCNMCSKYYDTARQEYNRNIFFMLLPLGLAIVILGIYLTVDYIGAGLMFAGLIVMFYATIRYFSDMSKILRAVIVLIEFLLIMWIGYKKIREEVNKNNNKNKDSRNSAERAGRKIVGKSLKRR